MKLLEYFSVDNGIFTFMKKVNADDYSALIGDTLPASDYDLTLLATCGERTAAPVVVMSATDGALTDSAKETLALVIWAKYGDSWKRVHDALYSEYTADSPYNVVTETESTDSGNAESTNKNVSKVYGYNSDDSGDGVNDTASTTTDNSTTGATHKSTVTVHGNTGNRTRAEIIQTELNLRRTQFLDVVFNDIKNFLTNAVYE